MRPWSAKIELRRQAVLVTATIAVVVSANAWPRFAWPIWGGFLFCLACYLAYDLSDPVNYESMTVTDEAIDYVDVRGHAVIRLDDIARVEFVRALDWDSVEPSWHITTLGGEWFEVMDEWPDHWRLFRTFRRRLPGFDAAAARKGFRSWKEGRWLCFQR